MQYRCFRPTVHISTKSIPDCSRIISTSKCSAIEEIVSLLPHNKAFSLTFLKRHNAFTDDCKPFFPFFEHRDVYISGVIFHPHGSSDNLNC